MGCGCGGSKYVPPTNVQEGQQAGQRVMRVTDANDPGNFWTGPQPPQSGAIVAPADPPVEG